MKANELRIGNLLREKVTKTELKVIELTENNIVTYVIDRSLYPLYSGWKMEPIPLTEEWLFKFRFVYNPHSSEFHGKNMIFHNWIKDRGYVSWGSTQIKYVHQLQNLYFALTGEELTYGGNK